MTISTVAEGSTVSNVISALLEIFSSIFLFVTNLVTENWILFVSIGVPLVAGVVFGLIHAFKSR